MSKNIPKASKIKGKKINNSVQKLPDKSKHISFSFEILERTEYFNLDVTCNNWPSDLFDVLKEISGIEKNRLISGEFARSKYRIHNHIHADPPSKLPEGVELKDLYQIRIEKSKGGIHGVFYENIFFVLWLDPLHNMYPDKKYGGLREIKPPSTCCRERDRIIGELKDENKELKEELCLYKDVYEE